MSAKAAAAAAGTTKTSARMGSGVPAAGGSLCDMEPKVFPLAELRRSPTALLFQGGDDIDASMFITEYDEGGGPDLHLHPYPELFLVEEGFATFTVGDTEHRVEAGNIVVVPPETPHGFKNREPSGRLRVVSVHPSPTVQQTNL